MQTQERWKSFLKNSHSDLDIELRTLEVKLAQILSYPTFVWSYIKNPSMNVGARAMTNGDYTYETTILNNSRANNFGVTWRILLIIELIWDLVPINTLCNSGPDWLRNVVSIALTRFKTAIFNNSRANNFGVTRRISQNIELIWNLVPINTLCNFGWHWSRNVVSISPPTLKTAIFYLSGPITLELLGRFCSLSNSSKI